MPVSPRTQAMMQPPPTEEDATLAFEDGFSQLAQRIFTSKFPELVEFIVTFKIIKTEIDNNSGVGAFILDINGETVFVPTVLAGSQIKPLDIMYFKEKDIFLPLTPEWLEEVSRGSLDNLGAGVEPPKTLDPDQDIRNVMVPPTVGRYAYASAQPNGVKLAQFLSEAPNHVKEAFTLVLEKNHGILKYAFENFDKDMILESLRPNTEKTAAMTGEEEQVTLLTPNESADTFKKTFGRGADVAWQESVKKGYVVSDTRKNANRAVETEGSLKLTNVAENGFYWIYMQDGSRKRALAILNPQRFRSNLDAGKRVDQTKLPDPYKLQRKKTEHQKLIGEDWPSETPSEESGKTWMLYFDNGDIKTTGKAPLGEPIPYEEISGGLLKKLEGNRDSIGTGYGVFLRFSGGKFQGTEPIDILSVSTGSDGIRRAKTGMGNTLVTDPKDPIKQIVAPNNSNVTYIPSNFIFVRGKEGYETKLLEGASDTLPHIENLEKVGALKVKLIDAGADLFSIGGLESTDKLATVQNLMVGLQLRQGEAEELMEKTASHGHASFYVVNPGQLEQFKHLTKVAQGEMPPPPTAAPGPQGAMPMGGPPGGVPAEGAPPAEGEMAPPEMIPPEAMIPMEPPGPPPPSPVELAVDEIGAEVAGQSEQVVKQLAEEQRELGNKMNILQAVKDRANQIASEMGGEMLPGEAPPVPPEQVPPEMPAGPEDAMEAPPGGPMEAGGPELPPAAGAMPAGGAMPQDAGAMPPGGAGAMPPGGAMPPEGPGAMEMANTAEPMMAQAAGAAEKLKDPSMFEATAIGAMAADSSLQSSVADFMPTLEEAVDNLGRILFTLWLEESTIREDMGEDDFSNLETQLLTVFKNMGDLILKINRTAMPVKQTDEEVA